MSNWGKPGQPIEEWQDSQIGGTPTPTQEFRLLLSHYFPLRTTKNPIYDRSTRPDGTCVEDKVGMEGGVKVGWETTNISGSLSVKTTFQHPDWGGW